MDEKNLNKTIFDLLMQQLRGPCLCVYWICECKSTCKYLFHIMFWPSSYLKGRMYDSVFDIVSELQPHRHLEGAV